MPMRHYLDQANWGWQTQFNCVWYYSWAGALHWIEEEKEVSALILFSSWHPEATWSCESTFHFHGFPAITDWTLSPFRDFHQVFCYSNKRTNAEDWPWDRGTIPSCFPAVYVKGFRTSAGKEQEVNGQCRTGHFGGSLETWIFRRK